MWRAAPPVRSSVRHLSLCFLTGVRRWLSGRPDLRLQAGLAAFVETAAFPGRLIQERSRAHGVVLLLGALRKTIQHPKADHLLFDADLGCVAEKLVTGGRVQIDPALRR